MSDGGGLLVLQGHGGKRHGRRPAHGMAPVAISTVEKKGNSHIPPATKLNELQIGP